MVRKVEESGRLAAEARELKAATGVAVITWASLAALPFLQLPAVGGCELYFCRSRGGLASV